MAVVGLAAAAVCLANSLVAGDLARQTLADQSQAQARDVWSLGLTTAAFGTVKLAIGNILLGIGGGGSGSGSRA